uniref:Uncharacterized protein n=1 Tax=Anguilla anguilla TaxID=7936 RepID=A0A0E9QFH7_ANGAN
MSVCVLGSFLFSIHFISLKTGIERFR